jgi:hypothetical protein
MARQTSICISWSYKWTFQDFMNNHLLIRLLIYPLCIHKGYLLLSSIKLVIEIWLIFLIKWCILINLVHNLLWLLRRIYKTLLWIILEWLLHSLAFLLYLLVYWIYIWIIVFLLFSDCWWKLHALHKWWHLSWYHRHRWVTAFIRLWACI